MEPIDRLMEEHRRIEVVLTCLERIAGQARESGRLDAESAGQAIDFFQNYADKTHHAKEEKCLFPCMESHGFPHDTGPVAVMRQEHEMGRTAIGGMVDAATGAGAGDGAAVREFISHAETYISLLRAHIDKENHCLFPMANDALPPAVLQDLGHEFDRVDNDEIGQDTIKKYEDLADALAERFDVATLKP